MNNRFEPSPAFVTKTGWVNPFTTGVKRRAGGILAAEEEARVPAEIKLEASTQRTIRLTKLRYFFIETSLFLRRNDDCRDSRRREAFKCLVSRYQHTILT